MSLRPAGKLSILAIGTELTTGQITNRNAATLSEKCVALGLECVLHETVADEREAILRALERCASLSQVVIICGGLGPTSDDFTRNVVAEWLGAGLEFNDESWKKIETRLQGFGIRVADSNRQQAYFPKGATVLKNPAGTADGFACRIPSTDGIALILPGPPREIEAIWKENQLDEWIRNELPQKIEALKLFSWNCMGKSEAELGEITEAALQGSGFATGYRFHRPYVEVKVWVPESAIAQSQKWFAKLESAIGLWVVTKNGEDLAALFLDGASRADEIDIIDAGSGGVLAERLAPLLRASRFRNLSRKITLATEWETPSDPIAWVEQALSQADDEALTLALAGMTADGKFCVGLKEAGRSRIEMFESPWKLTQNSSQPGQAMELWERFRPLAAESAIKTWRDWLLQSLS